MTPNRLKYTLTHRNMQMTNYMQYDSRPESVKLGNSIF